MAYVLGYFAADGSMIKHKNGGHFIEFTSTDRILLEHVQIAAGSNHTISVRERGGNCKTAYRLQVGSKEWYSDLLSLGFIQNKSNTLLFPSIPPDQFGHFVRGYFDGDGCVYFNQLQFADRVEKRQILMTLFTSGCRAFLEELWTHLKRHGVKGGSLKPKTRGFELVLSHCDSLALYSLMYHTVPESSLFLPRKREKLERAIAVLGLDKNAAVV